MSDFSSLAQAALENPAETDFIALRQAYIESDVYRPTSHFSANKLMGNTNNLNGWDEVVTFCEGFLEANPMDLEVWMLAAQAYENVGNESGIKKADAFIRGMLGAIRQSGDGRTKETAIKVIAVAEEYTILSVMGYKSAGQALMLDDERVYDHLTCKPRGGQGEDVIDVYFDITEAYHYLRNMME